MSIPNFKNKEDCDVFLKMFEDRLAVKVAMLNRVKSDLFPVYEWHTLQPKTLEVINDIVTNLLYDVDRQFKETHQDYKTDDDEMFIPYRSFKENVAEALKEALESQKECPPCDTLSCADHLTDE